jgi:hypothetical protein
MNNSILAMNHSKRYQDELEGKTRPFTTAEIKAQLEKQIDVERQWYDEYIRRGDQNKADYTEQMIENIISQLTWLAIADEIDPRTDAERAADEAWADEQATRRSDYPR